jgi:hypothetical protein
MDRNFDAFDVPVQLWRELRAQGWTDRGISQQVREGVWSRPRRGAYVDAPTWEQLDATARHIVRTRAVVKQAETEVVVSHVSGVPIWEGPDWGLDLTDVHTTRKDGKTGRKEAGVHQHCGALLDEDVATVKGIEVMAPARLSIEVSAVSPMEPAVVVLIDFLHRGLTTAEAVRNRYDATMDHWPDTRASEIVIRLGDPRIASVLEARFWFLCFRTGLPAPIPQYPVTTPGGHVVAELDFAWPDLGAYVETNGKRKYLELLKPGQKPGDVIERERRRDEIVGQLTGFRGLHLGWSDLDSQRLTAQRVRDHLWPTRAMSG